MEIQPEENLKTHGEGGDAPQNGFLFIGELAKLTGTDPKTIRFYERAELISPPLGMVASVPIWRATSVG